MIKRLYRRAYARLRPPNPHCSWMHTFSQEGEDVLLDRVFENKPTGFYVDVGAHHPTRFSNTYSSYLRGWNGINIDPRPGMATEFADLRPRDINLEFGIGTSAGMLDYYMFNEPALNTFDRAVADQRNGLRSYRLVDTKKVPVRPLAEVLKSYLPPSQKIDFLTVDVEGLDLEVLKSNDWSAFQPRLVLAEDPSAISMELAINCPLTLYMAGLGYEFFAKTFCTMFFRRRDPNV